MALITDLPVKTTIQSTDVIAVDDGSHTYQMTYEKFLQLVPMVSAFGKNDTTGELCITLTNGQQLKIIPHDPQKQDKQLSSPITVDGTAKTTVEACLTALNTYIGTKQNSLTFDNVPSAGSNNPVKSGGVYSALEEKADAIDLDGKVDKVSGKGLSTEDYTTAEKTKLSSVQTGAEANVQSDWNQTNEAADDYIKNKPDLTVDDELSPTSENPVQNKVIYEAIVNPEATILAMLDGTKTTYDKVMKRWFELKGAKNCTPAELTALCEEWYEKTRVEWDGNTTFAQPSVTAVSTGTAGGDNAGMICTPSTNTVAGRDDYAGHPLFACKDVNFEIDANTLDIIITDIDGVTDGFERSNPDRYVGVMQMSGYRYQYEDTTSYTVGYRATFLSTYADIEPLPESVRVDGSIRQFVVHGKYNTGINGSKMTQCSGQKVRAFISHNTLHTFSTENGAPYSGTATPDLSFLQLMTWIKYKSLTLDTIMAGCNNYNAQYYAQVSETNVKRVLVPTSAIIEVGSVVIIGTYGSSADRGTASNYNITGQYGAEVTAVENVTISGTTYKAVYVDIDTAFNTVANGSAVSGSTIISTWHWKTGMTDSVLGNDGSYASNTDNRHPFKLQGIECMIGGYEVLADVIMNIETLDGVSKYVPCIVKLKSLQATSVTANYRKITDLAIACPASASWQYIKKQKYKEGVTYPEIVGGSSSTYTRDGFYMNANGTTGTREWLAFGTLNNGAAAGLSCLIGSNALPHGNWTCLARLSPNGNRGEWTA